MANFLPKSVSEGLLLKAAPVQLQLLPAETSTTRLKAFETITGQAQKHLSAVKFFNKVSWLCLDLRQNWAYDYHYISIQFRFSFELHILMTTIQVRISCSNVGCGFGNHNFKFPHSNLFFHIFPKREFKLNRNGMGVKGPLLLKAETKPNFPQSYININFSYDGLFYRFPCSK